MEYSNGTMSNAVFMNIMGQVKKLSIPQLINMK